jgi:hypothetical protein
MNQSNGVPLAASGAAAVPFPVGAVMMMDGEPGVLAAAAMHSLVVRLQAAPVSAQLESWEQMRCR